MTRNTNNKVTKSDTSHKRTSDELIFEHICESFEDKYGHGWKRRLAEFTDVPESNVHSWIKAGKIPHWILRLFQLRVQKSRLQREKDFVAARIEDFLACDQVVETDDGFTVYRFMDGIGKRVAGNIPDIEMAREYASLPRLKALAERARELLDILMADEVIPEDSPWASDADKLVRLIDTWNRPAVLQSGEDDMINIDSVFEDIAEALEALPEEIASGAPGKAG